MAERVNGWRLSEAQRRAVEFLSRRGALLCVSHDYTNICATNGEGYLILARSTFLALNRRGLLEQLPHAEYASVRRYTLKGGTL